MGINRQIRRKFSNRWVILFYLLLKVHETEWRVTRLLRCSFDTAFTDPQSLAVAELVLLKVPGSDPSVVTEMLVVTETLGNLRMDVSIELRAQVSSLAFHYKL